MSFIEIRTVRIAGADKIIRPIFIFSESRGGTKIDEFSILKTAGKTCAEAKNQGQSRRRAAHPARTAFSAVYKCRIKNTSFFWLLLPPRPQWHCPAAEETARTVIYSRRQRRRRQQQRRQRLRFRQARQPRFPQARQSRSRQQHRRRFRQKNRNRNRKHRHWQVTEKTRRRARPRRSFSSEIPGSARSRRLTRATRTSGSVPQQRTTRT